MPNSNSCVILFLFLTVLLSLFSKSYSESTTQSNDENQILLGLEQYWRSSPALDSWTSSTSASHCSWTGVACANGIVTSITLTTQYLTNPIPSSICLLKNLSYLNVSYNNFASSFPTALYKCSTLEDLDLSNNAFTGPLPANINRLSAQLQHLNLSSNHFTGDVPPAIAKFPRLKSLVLDTNRFDGTYPSLEISNLAGLEMLTLAVNPFAPAPVPEEFGKLTNLTYLSLSQMNMTGKIPNKLSNLRNLTRFDLSMNKLHGTIPTWVWQLENLQYLYLYSSSLTGEIARTVAAVNLVEIDLSMNALTGSIPEDFGKLNSLTLLFLYYNQLSGPIPASIGLLPKLYDIRLFNNALSGVLPPELGKHSQLVNLEVSNNHLSGQLPESLCSNLKLDDIVVFNNNFSGPLPANLGACHLLDNIMLYNNHFTGEFPQSIWSFAKLTTVMIHDNNFTGAMPTELSSNISRIEMGNNRFSGAIPTSATKLQVFKAANNLFTGEIPQDMTKLANLDILVLAGNQISGSIPPTIKTLQKLNSLDLSSNRISGVIPPEIGLLPALTSLDLSDNEFTGEIRVMQRLITLDLSNNRFSGGIPASLWISVNRNGLSIVNISNNDLSGVIPTQLPWNFRNLDISNNRFYGPIPTLAGKMEVFKAANNLLSGEIPWDLTGITQMVELDLSGNRISGSIPVTIGVLQWLNALNLSSNRISGNIPTAFGFLPMLTILDLSENELSGEIPKDFNKLNFSFLNLSVNYLTGEIPASLQNQAYDKSFLSNPGLCVSSNYSKPNLPVSTVRSNGHNDLSRRLIILFSMLAGIVLVGTALSVFLIFKRRTKRQDQPSWKLTSFHVLDFTEHDVLGGLREDNWIGSGGSGKVYRINIDNDMGDNRMVAVKKIWNMQKLDEKLEKEFLAEVQILGAIRHANIVKLLCCISSSDSKLLVYEYMENGSLDRWLHHRERLGTIAPLDWPTRLGIAIGAARGLCYMHHNCSPAIVHRDVKSSNILLDMDFRAKIADFGLARILVKAGEPESVSAIAGTFGYMPPEYGYQRKVNEKVDVYSFGVVLLELITGKVANGGGTDYCLADWAWQQFQECGFSIDLADEDIRDPTYLDDMMAVFTLGLICTGGQPSSRPSMKNVLQGLLRVDRKSRVGSLHRTEYDEEPLLQA